MSYHKRNLYLQKRKNRKKQRTRALFLVFGSALLFLNLSSTPRKRVDSNIISELEEGTYGGNRIRGVHSYAAKKSVEIQSESVTELESSSFTHTSHGSNKKNVAFINKEYDSSTTNELITDGLANVAIVMPFVKCQVKDRIKQNLESWRKYPPCTTTDKFYGNLTFFFHYNKNLDDDPELESELLNIWFEVSDQIRNCFNSDAKFISSDLSEIEDKYPRGPCLQFWRSFEILKELQYDHWFQYEPDVFPIQVGWGTRMLSLAADNYNCQHWWELGSMPHYPNPVNRGTIEGSRSLDQHMNGNALYCLKSRRYSEYRSKVRKFYAPDGCDGPKGYGELSGFDHAMYRFRVHMNNSEIAHKIMHKFRLDEFILNYGESEYDRDEVLEAFPLAMLVHSKFHVVSEEEKGYLRVKYYPEYFSDLLSRIFWMQLGRMISVSEKNYFSKLISLGIVDRGNIHKILSCVLWKVFDCRHLNNPSFFSQNELNYNTLSCDGQHLRNFFPSRGYAIVAGQFMKIHNRMPGPEVAELIHRIESYEITSCADIISKICSLHFGGDDVGKKSAECRKYDSYHSTFVFKDFISKKGKTNKIDGRTEISFVQGMSKIFQSTDFSGTLYQSSTDKSLLHDISSIPVKLWTTDLHAGPIGCSVNLFKELNIEVTAKIDFGNCEFFQDTKDNSVCANNQNLKVLSFNNWRGFDLGPCPLKLRKKFYNAYKSDEEFEAIDTIICSHPVANCELYMPFNKSMIIYATTRLEFGRYDENVSWRKTSIGKSSLSRWHEWIHNLRLIAENPGNFIAANNLYDAKYIEYYSGIRAKYIPSWCGGDLASLQQHFYRPTRREIVITPYRTNLEYSADKTPRTGWPNVDDENAKINMLDHEVFTELRNELQRGDAEYGHFEFHTMKSVFPRGYNSMNEFKQFPACVFIPYQSSTMFFFQLYRQSVPILVPDKSLLISWIKDYKILWERVYGNPPSPTYFDEHNKMPPPNSFNYEDMVVWIDFYDIYQEKTFPHLIYFKSWSHALELLRSVDLQDISVKMHVHNSREFFRIGRIWQEMFTEQRKYRKKAGNIAKRTLRGAMIDVYGVDINDGVQDSKWECLSFSENIFSSPTSQKSAVGKYETSKCVSNQASKQTQKTLLNDPLMQGSYLKVCKNPMYDPDSDILRCEIGAKVLQLTHPYNCANDISISPFLELQC